MIISAFGGACTGILRTSICVFVMWDLLLTKDLLQAHSEAEASHFIFLFKFSGFMFVNCKGWITHLIYIWTTNHTPRHSNQVMQITCSLRITAFSGVWVSGSNWTRLVIQSNYMAGHMFLSDIHSIHILFFKCKKKYHIFFILCDVSAEASYCEKLLFLN